MVFLKWIKSVGPTCILFPLPAGLLTCTHNTDAFLIQTERNGTYIDHSVLLLIFCRFWSSSAASIKRIWLENWGNEMMYVKAAPMIVGMAVAMELSFDQNCDLTHSNLLLNFLFGLWQCFGCTDETYKLNGCVCFCLSVSSKNRNPIYLGISEGSVFCDTRIHCFILWEVCISMCYWHDLVK